MAVHERARREMFERLEQVLGADAADSLMAHLPPLGWGEVATKQDLETLAHRLEAKFLRVTLFTNLTAIATVAALAFGAAKLT